MENKKRKELTEIEKHLIIRDCLVNNGEAGDSHLTFHSAEYVANKWNKSNSQIRRIFYYWKSENSYNHDEKDIFKSKKAKIVGRKLKLTENVNESMKNVIREFNGDITYRKMETEMNKIGNNICFQTLNKYSNQIGIKSVNFYSKPKLTQINQIERLKFVLSQIDAQDKNNLIFKDHQQRVHLDEKWFYLERLRKSIKLIPNEENDIKFDTLQSKGNRTKLMFSVAISEPSETCNGLISIIPIANTENTKRSSINRPAGTPILVAQSIDHKVFYDIQVRKDGTIDNILKKYGENQNIIVQIDNAPPHVGMNTLNEINNYCRKNGYKIKYETQPPNSPDLNILDLAIFNSIQKRVDKLKFNCSNLVDFADKVEEIFNNYDKETLQSCFGHLYSCYNQILIHLGSNQYSSPHCGIRTKCENNQAINTVDINYDKYIELKGFCKAALSR